MLMTGDPILADRALAWGLVSEIVAPDELLPRARAIATTIASRAPIAAETAKLNLRAAFAMPQEKAIEYERDLQTICFATSDAAEGRAAFKEKRQPQFRAVDPGRHGAPRRQWPRSHARAASVLPSASESGDVVASEARNRSGYFAQLGDSSGRGPPHS